MYRYVDVYVYLAARQLENYRKYLLSAQLHRMEKNLGRVRMSGSQVNVKLIFQRVQEVYNFLLGLAASNIPHNINRKSLCDLQNSINIAVTLGDLEGAFSYCQVSIFLNLITENSIYIAQSACAQGITRAAGYHLNCRNRNDALVCKSNYTVNCKHRRHLSFLQSVTENGHRHQSEVTLQVYCSYRISHRQPMVAFLLPVDQLNWTLLEGPSTCKPHGTNPSDLRSLPIC